MPIYSAASDKPVKMADISPEATRVRDVKYVAAADTMWLGVYSKDRPYQTQWCPMCREIRRYDAWSTKPRLALTIPLPYDESTGVYPMSQAIAGDYLFVGFMNGGDARHSNGEILIYRTHDGVLMGALRPSADVGGISGWIDIQTGAVNAWRRADGAYLVMAEDDARAKIMLYQWKPPAGPPVAPRKLTGWAGDGVVVLEWPRSMSAQSYQVKRGSAEGAPIRQSLATSVTASMNRGPGSVSSTPEFRMAKATVT